MKVVAAPRAAAPATSVLHRSFCPPLCCFVAVVGVDQPCEFLRDEPAHRCSAADTNAAKAVGYGMPGLQVDGNDVFAVYEATKEAVDRARSGGGPTLIEAVTYRMGPHSSADDPNRYRTDEQLDAWRKRDPLERLRRFLAERNAWTADWQEALDAEAAEEIERAVAAAEALPEPGPGDVFDSMFAEPPPHRIEQRAWAMER